MYSNIYPTRCNFTQFIYIWKLLYMFRVVPIMRRAYNWIYSIWYLSQRYCYVPLPVPTLPQERQVAVTVWQIPDAVDTVVCNPDGGWRYHPKHVEQFPDKNKLRNVASCYIYIYVYIYIYIYIYIFTMHGPINFKKQSNNYDCRWILLSEMLNVRAVPADRQTI